MLEKFIAENQLEENVKILGFTDNPYPYIKHSVATVLTSLSEGFSLALVESVMLNTPILSMDVGVAAELIGKYRCGEIIPYDEKKLAAVMLRYLENYDGYKRPFHVGDEYLLSTEVAGTVQVIEEALAEKDGAAKMKKLPYPEETIREYELDGYEVKRDITYVLRVLKDGVPYEYLIRRRSSSDKLIVFHNGAVAEGHVSVPVFQRHSWIERLKTSCIFCMDPTLYLNGLLQAGWGVGKNDNYYLENSSLILKRLIAKAGIRTQDTVVFGTSAGGFLSIITGIYLKGASVVADNAQLDVANWIFKDALDCVISFCFDNIGDALRHKERFNVIDAFEKHGYVPKIYLHVNACSVADNSTQLVPFLARMEQLRAIKEYNDMEIYLHYAPEKAHNGIDMDDAIDFLYSVLGVEKE